MPKRDGLSLSKREAQLVSNSADNQPSWARSLLRQDTKEEDEELVAYQINANLSLCFATEDDPATRLNSFSVRSKADLLHLVHGGDGCGVLVDDALCASYAGAAEDVKQLISSKAVRSVRPQREEKLRRRKSAEVLPEDTYPVGEVLFSRFEPEVEALKTDEDIRQAFHATARPAQGDVTVRLPAPVEGQEEQKGLKRQQKVRKVQNVHMPG
ncbi:unnamed protein product [Durusdinium trenchii]|uniref:Uncharacterized protein n=1 Tax=Durusdinium trenchii TaxID=1381693 RepID=A0ABP0K5Z7_9DINO